MPEVSNCCCCISLRAGTITFGVLSCIGSLIAMIMGGVAVATANQYVDSGDITPEAGTAVKAVAIVTIVIFSIGALLSIFMTWGAVQRKTGILKAWIVILWIGIVLDCIVVIMIPFLSSMTSEEKIKGVVQYIIQGVFAAYQLLVVHSYRQQILRESCSA